MSGKLKLLPHKSWNVWNRDNREKVLKDKRLLQEENDIKSKRDKELEQEHILTVLKSTASNTAHTNATNTNTTNTSNNNTTCNVLVNTTNDNDKQLESFRLFDDIEEKLQKQKQNEDYKKEKEMKELLKQRREGTAPWGLADGSHEKSKMKPWYINNDVKASSSSSSNEKDIDDKSRLDPMARFIIRDRYEYEYHQRNHDDSNNNNKSKSSIPILSNINTIMGLNKNNSTSSSNDNSKEKKKHKKKRDRSNNDDNDKDDDNDRHKHKKEKKHNKKHKHKHD
jgi:hypothetical protein